MANKDKVYLKIGIYQSVIPVPIDEHNDLVNYAAGRRLSMTWRDSGSVESDGVPIWIATSIEVSDMQQADGHEPSVEPPAA